MPAMSSDDGLHARVSRYGRIAKRFHRHEWIVFGGEDERWHRDAIDHPHGARPMVVVGGISKTVIRSRVSLVELADGPDAAQRFETEDTGNNGNLPAHACLQPPHEVPL